MYDLEIILKHIRPNGGYQMVDGGAAFLWDETFENYPSNEEIAEAREELSSLINKIQIDQFRREAYQTRADPIFFKWQRGEATEQQWQDEIAAIRAEFPEEG